MVRQLAPLGLAFLHIIEGTTGAAGDHQQGDTAFDYAALREAYRDVGGKGAWMVNNSLDKALADASLAHGADLVAFGRPFIANHDLTRRLRDNAPLNALVRATPYGGGAQARRPTGSSKPSAAQAPSPNPPAQGPASRCA